MWRLRAWVIVKTRGKTVVRGTSPPAESFTGIASVAVPCFQVASLSLAEPVIMLAESWIDGFEEVHHERAREMGIANIGIRGGFVGGAEDLLRLIQVY